MARRALSGVLAVAAVAVTAFALARFDLSTLADAAPGWIAAALALNSTSMLLRGFAWLRMLRAALPGVPIGAGRVLRATMIGVLGSTVAPARAGEPARVWLVSRGLKPAGAVATVIGTLVSQTLLNLAALAVLALVAVLGVGVPAWRPSGLAVIVLPALAVVVILGGAHAARAGFLARQLRAMRDGLSVLGQPRHGPPIIALQSAAWLAQCLAAYTLLLALDLDVAAPLATAAALLLAVNITAVMPVTPSNIGVFQAACLAVLAAQGVPAGPALAYGVLLQATEIVTAVALGVTALIGEGSHLRPLRVETARAD